MSDVTELGAEEALDLFQVRRLSPVELTHAYLERIEHLNGTLNAYLAVTPDLALKAAAASEERIAAGKPLRPLEGLPVALKDNMALTGAPMTAGSPFLEGNVPREDAEVTRRLKEAGAVILGKLNLHEWALGATGVNPHFGPARNPWDPARMTGGSSSGSGAASGGDLTLLALGSDTGGSGRIPAALCNTSGLRPTTGRISSRGVVPLAWSFDVVAPMARRAADVARLLGVLAGYDPADPTSVNVPAGRYLQPETGVAGLRIALLTGFFEREAEPEVAGLVREAAQTLTSLGARVEELEIPDVEETIPTLTTMLQSEAAAFHARRLEEAPERFGPSVAERLQAGRERSASEYGLARQAARIWTRRLEEIFQRFDLLLSATCAITAPLIGDSRDVSVTRQLTRLTYAWSLTGAPALSIPCGFVEGLPVGAQLAGRPWDEATVLRAARAYQSVTDWHLRRPKDASLSA